MAGVPPVQDLKLGSMDDNKLRQMWHKFFSRLNEAMPVKATRGNGSPEGVVEGNKGDLYLNSGAGATLWVKETTGGKTGWVAK